eukprot:7496809-Alexandrium_andersonii.AAC.1
MPRGRSRIDLAISMLRACPGARPLRGAPSTTLFGRFWPCRSASGRGRNSSRVRCQRRFAQTTLERWRPCSSTPR